MRNRVFVRTAGKRDIAAIRALLVETWHATYDAIYGVERVTEITGSWHSEAALSQRLDQPDSEFIVADDGETIAGMAFARAADEGRTIMLQQLYVLPRFQNAGIGSLLLDEIEGSFHDAGRIRLQVEEANAQALSFYRARGFVEAGHVRIGSEEADIPVLVMEKPIIWAD